MLKRFHFIYKPPSFYCRPYCTGELEHSISLQAMAYWAGALTISVLFATAGLTCAIGTREQKGSVGLIVGFSYVVILTDQQKVDKKVSFFQGLKLTMKFKPYFYLVMMYMFGWVAVNVSWDTVCVIAVKWWVVTVGRELVWFH